MKTKDEVAALRVQVAELIRKVDELTARLNLMSPHREIHHHHYPATAPITIPGVTWIWSDTTASGPNSLTCAGAQPGLTAMNWSLPGDINSSNALQ